MIWIKTKEQIDSVLSTSCDSVYYEDYVMNSNLNHLFAETFGTNRSVESLSFSESEFFYLKVITAYLRSDTKRRKAFLKQVP